MAEQRNTNDGFGSAEIAEAWALEIARRIDDLDSGKTEATDAHAAIGRVRKLLIQQRAAKSSVNPG